MTHATARPPYMLYAVLAAVILAMFQGLYSRAIDRAALRDLHARHAPLDTPRAGDMVVLVADEPGGVSAEVVAGSVTVPNGTRATIRRIADGAIVVELLATGQSATVLRSNVRKLWAAASAGDLPARRTR